MQKNIVLLHGWGAEIKKLEPLKMVLESLGWKVLLPKLPGFENPPPDKVWGVENYADYVYKIVKTTFVNQNYILFGHSFGGSMVIKLASRNTTGLAGIVLCAPGGMSRGKVLKRMLFKTLAKTGKILLVVPEFASKFKKLLYKAAHEHDYEKTEGIMREVFKKVVSEDLKSALKNIKVPSLVLWGRKDKMTPFKDAFYIKERIKRTSLFSFENEGHNLPYVKPKEVARKIEKWFTSLK